MILVDTSIWIDHINSGTDEHLDYLLAGESVFIHDFVIGEIAMGSLKNRKMQLAFLSDLHRIPSASHHEALYLVEAETLHGTGLSYVDAHLVAAALAFDESQSVRIWTRDKGLHEASTRLGIAYRP